MALDLHNQQDCSRLQSAIKRSRETMALFDANRSEMLRDYAGPLYSPYSPRRVARYVNKLNTTATIYQTALCYNNPRCKVTSFSPKNWPFCRRYETNINRVVANINLRTALQECVMDAFFLLGAVKVYRADAGLKEIESDVWMDVGKP